MKNTHITTRAEREAMSLEQLRNVEADLEKLAYNAFQMRDPRFGFLDRQLQYVRMEIRSRKVRA